MAGLKGRVFDVRGVGQLREQALEVRQRALLVAELCEAQTGVVQSPRAIMAGRELLDETVVERHRLLAVAAIVAFDARLFLILIVFMGPAILLASYFMRKRLKSARANMKSDAGMAMLKQRMPHVDFSRFENDRDVNKVGELITVKSLVDFVERKLKA